MRVARLNDQPATPGTSRRWFIGLVIGLVFGLATLALGTTMAFLGLLATALVSIRPGRTAAVGGVLTGFGACWLALFTSAATRCGPGCSGPDLAPWVVVAGALLAAGLGLSALLFARKRLDRWRSRAVG